MTSKVPRQPRRRGRNDQERSPDPERPLAAKEEMPGTADPANPAVYWPKVVRYRPMSHKVIGGFELAMALVFIVFSYARGFGYRPLPIAPIWYQLVGWTLAYYSTFWFGWWDRPR